MAHQKKLTLEQKRFAICKILTEANYPMSPTDIGKRIGYINGLPLYQALEELEAEGWLTVNHGEYLKKPARWYWLTARGRECMIAHGVQQKLDI